MKGGKRGEDDSPRNAKEGIEVNRTERMLSGNKKYKCNEPGCKGKVGFGSKEILEVHKHIAHGK